MTNKVGYKDLTPLLKVAVIFSLIYAVSFVIDFTIGAIQGYLSVQ